MHDIRRRSHLMRFITLVAIASAAVLVVSAAQTSDKGPVTGAPAGLTSTTTTSDAPEAAVVAPDAVAAPASDEAKWVNGELMPPLPQDKTRRNQALDQALASAMARPNTGTPHTTGGPGGGAMPAGSRSTRDPLPNIIPYVPDEVKHGSRTWNLRLPDTFVAPAEAVLGIDPATGKALPQMKQDAAATAALAPALKQTWDSISQTTLTPPDCDVSVGPTNVVAVVNARMAFYDKCGTNQFETNIATFVGDATNFIFDPKVVYDVWDGRWVITCCVNNSATQGSWILLLVSDDSDPNGGWCYYYLDFRLNGGTPTAFWADYQDVGTSPDGIHITANMFNWANPAVFQYAKIRNIDKSGPYTCGGVCWWDFWSLTNPADGSLAFSLRAADMNSWPGEYLFVNSVSFGGNFLTEWRLVGPPCAPTSLTSVNLPVAVYDNPPAMQQPDLTFLDCDDARLQNLAYYSGNMWTGHGIRINWGEPADRSAIQVFQIQPFVPAVSFQTSFGASGLYYAYPAVDFDLSFSGIVAFSRGGPTENPGSRYVDLPNGGPWGASGSLRAGLSSYNGSVSAGTPADPFRWGDYYGCDLDPFDWQTLWFYGEATVNPFAWDTQVGATAPVGAGLLSVTPSPGLISGGFQGGPFDPPSIAYTVSNTGSSGLTWTLTGLAAWNTASSLGGELAAGGATVVTVSINAAANAFAPGVYSDTYSFTDCYANVASNRSTTLHVGVDGSCDGSKLVLTPSTPPPNFGADPVTFERGVYVTAIKDFDLCAISYKMDLATLPQALTARIYAANGTTRGALLASNSIAAVQLANVVTSIPITYTLLACQDYEIVVEVPGGAAWEWWDENLIAEPFDIGGAIRVRDGSSGGGAANFALPHFELSGHAAGSPNLTDLGGPGAAPNPASDDNQQRGVYIHMLDTGRLCGFGWEADLVAGQTLTANVYEAVGVVRGALVATGTYVVPLAGMRWHDVPLNAQLLEGKDYDVAITFGATNNWQWWDENATPPPFTKDIFVMNTSEAFGDGTNFALPHYRAHWEEKAGGMPFNLAKLAGPNPPPNSTGQDNSQYGAYITSVVDQQIYSLGWMADIPAGQRITARVYNAAGVVRGTLISEGTAYSSGPGMRFHDVPVSAHMTAGGQYDISIEWDTVNLWRWWPDTSGLPYTSYGVITVRDGEANGGAGNTALINMRVFGCTETFTPVEDDHPQRTPMFLAVPAPNPVSSSSRLNFALEEAGPVSIVVYDVAGRRVTTLLDGQRPKGWSSIDLDSSKMASGVYFLKMQTSMKSLTRKFVVTH